MGMMGPRGMGKLKVPKRPGDKECPVCKRTYQVEKIGADGKVRCPKCNSVIGG